MTTRLQIINDALLATGNRELNELYDGSAEWRAAESAYRRAVGWAIGGHTWNFANHSTALGSRLPSSPDPRFENAFMLPGDCLHVEMVFLDGVPISDYEIIDNKICSLYETGLSVRYVRMPPPGQWPPRFVEAVTIKCEAFLLRGLNEDADSGRKRDAEAFSFIADASSMSDAQEPARAIFRSRSAARRRGRSAV